MYRGSRDGFNAKDFHTHCDGKANTIVFVYNSFAKKIGGRTQVPWSSPQTQSNLVIGGGVYKDDPTAFIFSLEEKQKFLKKETSDHAVYHSRNIGPQFGNDIVIRDDCDRQNWNTGMCKDYEYGHNNGHNHFAFTGHLMYRVKEIEVF